LKEVAYEVTVVCEPEAAADIVTPVPTLAATAAQHSSAHAALMV